MQAPFIEHLLRLFRDECPLLEARGTLILRQLCELLEPHQVFITLAAGLQVSPMKMSPRHFVFVIVRSPRTA